jgi:type I restriction enzyme S subunit
MRDGWQTTKLGQLCEIELGKTPARANSAFWDATRKTSNVWLSIADLLNAEDNIVVDSREYLSDKGASVSKIVPKGTLLVSFKLTLGRLAFAGRDLYTNEAIAALTIFNERELSKEFLFYFLHFFDWVKAAENDVKLKGMTLNKAKLKEMDVHFPKSIPEQRRIVGILDEAFEGIASAKANADRNLQYARAIFESHLQSVFAQRGPGWVEKPLGEVCEVKDGTHYSPKYVVDGVPFVTQKNIREEGLSFEKTKFISQKDHNDFYRRSNVACGDILISMIGAPGMACIVDDERTFSIKNVGLVKQNRSINQQFLLYFLKSPQAANYVHGASKGGVQQFLGLSGLRKFPIPLPPLKEQDSLADKIQLLRTEIQHLESIYQQKIAALETLKRSLLHQAFSGKL